MEQGTLIKNDKVQFNSSFSEHNDNEMVYANRHYLLDYQPRSLGIILYSNVKMMSK